MIKKVLLVLLSVMPLSLLADPEYKELGIDLPITADDIVPQGLVVDRKRIFLDLNQDDPLHTVSFKEIVDDDDKLVIALIHMGNPGDAKRSWKIYEAKEFNRTLIRANKKPFDLLNQ